MEDREGWNRLLQAGALIVEPAAMKLGDSVAAGGQRLGRRAPHRAQHRRRHQLEMAEIAGGAEAVGAAGRRGSAAAGGTGRGAAKLAAEAGSGASDSIGRAGEGGAA